MEKNEILIIYGQRPLEMAKEICRAAKLDELIGDKNKKIGLKPNLVVARPAETGATTHPELLAGVIEYLQQKGFSNISVIEGSWVGDRTAAAFRACGYTELSKKYGVPLIDTQKDKYRPYDCKGMTINICDSAMSVDFMINMPVLKGHCQTSMTCALKNGKGEMPDSEKRHFHTLGLHKPIAHLNTRVRNDFILVDGLCGDLDFEEGGNPVQMNRVMGCLDPVLCDAYVCDLMGYTLDDVPYIRMAASLGVGECDTSKAKITELNSDKNNTKKLHFSRKIEKLAQYTQPKDACSACYGTLIHALERMDERGTLRRLKKPVCIGQGYRGCEGDVGVGACTCKFKKSVAGCPPKAIDIINFLEKEI